MSSPDHQGKPELFPVSSAVQSLCPLVGEASARQLLEHFGTLKKIGAASSSDLLKCEGIGVLGAKKLKAAFELANTIAVEQRTGLLIIENSLDLARIVRDKLSRLVLEQLRVVLTNKSKRYLGDFEVATGTANSAWAEPCEVFKYAIEFNASSIYLAHNHPGGDPSPSREDIKFSQNLVRAGQIMGIPVVDHIIIGKPSRSRREGYVSLWDEGYLNL